MNDTHKFLRALFDDVPADYRFLVWSLPDKISRWYRPADTEKAANDARALDAQDVYVGVGLSTRDRGAKQRTMAKDVAGIVGLWLDVDFDDGADAHKKPNLPADVDAAQDLLASLGVDPTLLVHSGHGLQAWWLFAEPWLFESPEDHVGAAALANRWNLTLRVRAAERGYAIDSTFDLSRVMRVPGTTNRKAAPVPVRLLRSNLRLRYEPADVEPFMADEAALSSLGGRRTHTVGQLKLDQGAQPDIDKFDALMQNDTKFRQSWNRDRKELQDQSASSYDLSLASLAAAAGWSDQEIVDLLVASRRKHGDDLKLRHDYYARTVSRARDSEARAVSVEEIGAAQAQVERAEALGDERAAQMGKRTLLQHLSTALGVEITRMVRFTQDPPRYRMETVGGAVTLGHADAILSQPKMRAAIAGATRIVIARFKGPKWDEIAQAIFSACEDEDTGIESTEEGIAYAWLTEYLQDRPVLSNRDEAAFTQTPFTHDGQVYVFGSSFRRWLNLSRGDRVDAKRMGETLRSFGCEHVVMNVNVDGQRTSRSVWHVPGLEETLASRQSERATASERDARHAPAEDNGQAQPSVAPSTPRKASR